MKRLSDLFGRYSLPSVMGRVGHNIGGWFSHDGNTGVMPPSQSYYPITQVLGLTQGSFNGASGTGTSGPYTNPGVDPSQGNTGGGGSTGGGSIPSNAYTGFTGNSSGGTLGGGTAVDPSQWGQFGIGTAGDAGNSVPYATRYLSQMSDGGGFGGSLLGTGFFHNHPMHTGGNDPAQQMPGMQTGGALPPQGGYDSSGINPGGMYTGGNLPAQSGMTTGGNYPAQAASGMLGRLGGGRQPPGGLMR